MALEIVNLGDTFEIKGSLNKSNVQKFKSHFENIFNQTSRLVINIDELSSIDNYGVLAFEDLYKESLEKDKKLFITGYGCREMYEHLKAMKVA
ncbi:MAG TPA: STAS domain-containing protein [Flavobacteriaceae bacterium]|nr:STAS domain-containing protein [Flavobacteriaceae bacterium]